MPKQFISAEQLLRDSCALALRIAESGYRPTLLAGIWRGGTPVAITVHEVLEFLGCGCDHIAIRTSSYAGMEQQAQVEVHGLDYLYRKLGARDRLLLVDDVHDTGLSIQQVLNELQAHFGALAPEIRVAVPWFKPTHSRTAQPPDYYLHTTEDWLVFPHELRGLSDAEIMGNHGLRDLSPHLLRLRDQLAETAKDKS
ncbi:MAG TPA: phosphoribosyltransferase family protein [Pseudomonadales bacterium]